MLLSGTLDKESFQFHVDHLPIRAITLPSESELLTIRTYWRKGAF
jgi:hypothetical protein